MPAIEDDAAETTVDSPGPKASSEKQNEVQSSQLQWPDTVTLQENDKALIKKKSPEIIATFNKIQDICSKIDEIITTTIRFRASCYDSYLSVIKELNAVYQQASYAKGSLNAANLQEDIK
jgi:hypothetical protein